MNERSRNYAQVNENGVAYIRPKLVGDRELPFYLSLGKTSCRKIAELSGAKIHIGRRVLYDLDKIDNYINSLEG